MSDTSLGTPSSPDDNEHYRFVKLLAKHKNILGPGPVKYIEKREAAAALANEYNQQFEGKGKSNVEKITVAQVLKKVCNMKARLKEKNYKNLTRAKKLEYMDWEELFLDLWVGGGTTVLANKVEKPMVLNVEASDVKREEEDNVLENDPITPVDIPLQDISMQDSEVNSSTKIECRETENENRNEQESNYDEMPFDELEKEALISQIRAYKAEEASARAKRKLNEYKLSLLKREEQNDFFQ